jgi:hypothetical protein
MALVTFRLALHLFPPIPLILDNLRRGNNWWFSVVLTTLTASLILLRITRSLGCTFDGVLPCGSLGI